MKEAIQKALGKIKSARDCHFKAIDTLLFEAEEILEATLATPQPAQRKPQFKEFIKWAGIQGYDCAQTFNSDTGEWICLNPMTADLWRAWQAAHGIKENT